MPPTTSRCRWPQFSLQRGRALTSAEMRLGLGNLSQINAASTGPRSHERGDKTPADARKSIMRASTGPRSHERGDPQRFVGQAGLSQCFNGAALSRARRCPSGLHPRGIQRAASTGPRSHERGDKTITRGLPSLAAASTGPRSHERGDLAKAATKRAMHRCFNGAALSRARRLEPQFPLPLPSL